MGCTQSTERKPVDVTPQSAPSKAEPAIVAPVAVVAPAVTAEVTPASPAKVEVAPASPAMVEVAPASPAKVEVAPASPAKVEVAPASPAKVEVAPASPAKVEVAPASPAMVEVAPASPVKVEVAKAPIVIAPIAVVSQDHKENKPIQPKKETFLAPLTPLKPAVPVLALIASPNVAKTAGKRSARCAAEPPAAAKKTVAFGSTLPAPIDAAAKRKTRVRKAAGKHYGNIQEDVLLASIAAFERQLTHRSSLESQLRS